MCVVLALTSHVDGRFGELGENFSSPSSKVHIFYSDNKAVEYFFLIFGSVCVYLTLTTWRVQNGAHCPFHSALAQMALL